MMEALHRGEASRSAPEKYREARERAQREFAASERERRAWKALEDAHHANALYEAEMEQIKAAPTKEKRERLIAARRARIDAKNAARGVVSDATSGGSGINSTNDRHITAQHIDLRSPAI